MFCFTLFKAILKLKVIVYCSAQSYIGCISGCGAVGFFFQLRNPSSPGQKRVQYFSIRWPLFKLKAGQQLNFRFRVGKKNIVIELFI